MFCSNCGIQLEDDAVFCSNCGTKVEVEDKPEAETISEVTSEVEESAVAESEVESETVIDAEVVSDDNDDVTTEVEAEADAVTVIEAEADAETEVEIKVEAETEAEVETESEEKIEVVEGEIVGSDEKINLPAPEPEVQEAEGTSTTEIIVSNPGDASQIKYCHNCGAANSVNDAFCYSCGASMNEDTSDTKKKLNIMPIVKKVIMFAAIAAALVAVVFGLSKLFGGKGKSGIIYIKDDELNEWAKKEPNEIGGHLYSEDGKGVRVLVELSKDEKLLFYPQKLKAESFNQTFDLYYKKYLNEKDEGVKIASEVIDYKVLDNNNVVFISDGKLFISDLKDKEKIDSDVTEYWISKDQKTVVWYKGYDDKKIYYSALNMKPEKNKLASDVSSINYVSEDLKIIQYTDEDMDIYSIRNFGDKEKVASEGLASCGVFEVGNSTYTVLVEHNDSEDFDLDLVVDDDFPNDANIKEPILEDYQHIETKPSFWGTRETVVTDDKYYEDYDLYSEKIQRELLREELKNYCNLTTSDIYIYSYDKKEKEKIYSGPVSDIKSLGLAFSYIIIDLENAKKAKLSDLMEMSYSERMDAIKKTITSSSKIMVNNFSSEVTLDIDSDDYILASINSIRADKDSGIIYALIKEDYESEFSTLFALNSKKLDPTFDVITDEMFRFAGIYKGKPCYFSDPGKDYTSADLYIEGEKIASDVQISFGARFGRDESKDMFIYLSDANSKGEGDLYIYDGKAKEVASDVYLGMINDRGDVALISDYNFKKSRGDLKVWRNGKLTDVDEDVSSIIYF